MQYTVEVSQDVSSNVIAGETVNGQRAAKKAAREYVEKYPQPEYQVFVSWFRSSDGQHGYFNPDGNHSITGEAWENNWGGQRQGAGRPPKSRTLKDFERQEPLSELDKRGDWAIMAQLAGMDCFMASEGGFFRTATVGLKFEEVLIWMKAVIAGIDPKQGLNELADKMSELWGFTDVRLQRPELFAEEVELVIEEA